MFQKLTSVLSFLWFKNIEFINIYSMQYSVLIVSVVLLTEFVDTNCQITHHFSLKLKFTAFYKCLIWRRETWSLKIKSSEMWILRRLLRISWTDHTTNEQVLRRSNSDRELLDITKKNQTIIFRTHTRYKIFSFKTHYNREITLYLIAASLIQLER